MNLNPLFFFNISMILLMMLPNKKFKLHPMNFLLILILLTLCLIMTITFNYSSWLNFIIFLVIIGGLLIIFMYIISLLNNKMSYFPTNKFKFNIIKFLYLYLFMIVFYKMAYPHHNHPDLWLTFEALNEEKNEIVLSKLFNNYKYPLIFIIIYLFYSMLCIMNICYKFNSPLRQLYFYE